MPCMRAHFIAIFCTKLQQCEQKVAAAVHGSRLETGRQQSDLEVSVEAGEPMNEALHTLPGLQSKRVAVSDKICWACQQPVADSSCAVAPLAAPSFRGALWGCLVYDSRRRTKRPLNASAEISILM